MEIILLKQVKSLGKPGDIKEVKRGYALNFLIPQGFALPATKGFIKEVQSRIRKITRSQDLETAEIKSIIDEINGLEFSFAKKAGKEGKLFGSVKAKDIADALSEKIGKKVEEKYIILEEPLKKIGDYEIEIKAGEEIKANIKIKVGGEK